MSTIALITGPQDPSQLDNSLNSLIAQLNGYLTGSTPLVNPIVAGSTTGSLPTSGVVTLGSSGAAHSATYSLPRPTAAQIGQSVQLITTTTNSQLVTGLFNKSHTKITMKTTAGNTVLQAAVSLVALSTSAWGITGFAGSATSVKST